MSASSTAPTSTQSLYDFICDSSSETPIDINHKLFAVLALIETEHTEADIIMELAPKIDAATVKSLLKEIEALHYARKNKDGDDDSNSDWILSYHGYQMLTAYVLIMRMVRLSKK